MLEMKKNTLRKLNSDEYNDEKLLEEIRFSRYESSNLNYLMFVKKYNEMGYKSFYGFNFSAFIFFYFFFMWHGLYLELFFIMVLSSIISYYGLMVSLPLEYLIIMPNILSALTANYFVVNKGMKSIKLSQKYSAGNNKLTIEYATKLMTKNRIINFLLGIPVLCVFFFLIFYLFDITNLMNLGKSVQEFFKFVLMA